MALKFNPITGTFDLVGDVPNYPFFKKTRVEDLIVEDDIVIFLHDAVFVGVAELIINGTGEALSL